MLKKLLYLSPGPNYNAHTELFQNQYKLLSESFQGTILTTSSKSERFQIDNFMYASMKSDYTLKSTLKFGFFCIRNAIRMLTSRERPDLVTTYDPLTTGLIGLIVSRILRAKFAPEVNGVYTSPAEWLDEPQNMSTKIKKIIYPVIMSFVLKRADGIRLLFKDQIDPFQKVAQGKVIRHFHCFVPTNAFESLEERKEVLFVGFPLKRKGVDILIKAFKQISPKYPDWKLKILGWFPDLTELNEAIGRHTQIYHNPPVHYSEMPQHIGSCAILVLPSRSEAMGRVFVEAMAACKPTIGSNVDGIPSVINDGVDGLLFQSENVGDLANKLEILVSNPDLRKRVGNAGRERVSKEFTEQVYISNVVSFYNDVLES